jgi:ribose transport system substrate-binding protein
MRNGAGTRTALGAAIAIAAALGACAPSDGDNEPGRIALMVATSRLDVAIELADGFRAGVQDIGGIDPLVVGPPIVDGPRQLQLFQQLTHDAPAGISVFTLSPDLLAPPLAAAAADGIPLIAVDNRPPRSSNVTLFVGNDDYRLGVMLADEVIAGLPEDASGTIVLGDNPQADRRARGIRDELGRRRPRLSVVGPLATEPDVAANLAAWTTLVRAHPTAVAFLGTGQADGWSLASLRRSTGGRWLAGGFDLDPRALQAVKDGDLVLVSPEHFVKGAIAGRLQAKHAKDGRPLPSGWIYAPGLVVNAGNVDIVMARQASLPAKLAYFAPVVENILGDPSYLRPLEQAG